MTIYYCDGSGWNGQTASYCIATNTGKTIKKEYKEPKTNNEMEHTAVLEALKLAENGDEIRTDSQLVVGHLIHNWKITHETLYSIAMQSKQILTQKEVIIRWIPRKENNAGHLLG